MGIEFSGRDLVVRFKEDPTNRAIRQYKIEYQCANRSVVHYVRVDDAQGTDSEGLRLYKDQLSYAENEAAGLTRQPRVLLFSQNADLLWSTGLTLNAENPLPVLLAAPNITSVVDGVEVSVPMPSDRDFEGFVAWVGSTADFPLDAAHERYRGKASAFSLQLPDDDTYYLRVAPYDAFGLDTFAAWDALPVKRGGLGEMLEPALAASVTIKALQTAQAEISGEVANAQEEANTARSEVAAEILRAKGAEGAITTSVANLKTTVDGHTTTISDNFTTLTNADTSLATRAQALEATVNGVNGGKSLNAKITDETAARVNEDTALSGRISTTEAQLRGETGSAILTKITNEETTRASQDSALSTRLATTEAQFRGESGSTILTRITNEETARANGDSALATRTAVLEAGAASGGNYLNANPSYSNWPSATGLPTGWAWWAAGGTLTRENRAAAEGGGYAARFSTSGGETGLVCNAIPMAAGWYVMEADVYYNGGDTWIGSGLTLSGIYNLDFAREADTNGVVSTGGVGQQRRYSKLLQLPAGTYNFHPMVQWAGFGAGGYKDLTFRYAAIRPATDGEIKAQKASGDISTLSSRISNEESARATAVQAVANRTTVVEAKVANDSNNLALGGTFNHPSWVQGSTGAPPYWSIWSQDNGGYIGYNARASKYGAAAPLQIDRQGNNNGVYQVLQGPIGAGYYVLEADVDFEDGNHVGSGVHINFNNGYSRNFSFGTEADTNGGIGSFGNVNRKFSTLFYNGANSGSANFYLMAGWTGFTGAGGYGFLRTIWHKAIVRPATAGEIAAQKVQDSNLTARVTQTESAISGLNGRTAAYWQVQAVAGNNRAQMTVRADANGGGGVDIVGDVAITGSNGNGRTVINSSGVFVYYPSGQLAGRLSI